MVSRAADSYGYGTGTSPVFWFGSHHTCMRYVLFRKDIASADSFPVGSVIIPRFKDISCGFSPTADRFAGTSPVFWFGSPCTCSWMWYWDLSSVVVWSPCTRMRIMNISCGSFLAQQKQFMDAGTFPVFWFGSPCTWGWIWYWDLSSVLVRVPVRLYGVCS